MAETSKLALNVLKATGLYSDEALAKIADGRARNPEMGLVEAVLKFGGNKEADFLQKTGEVLGLDFIDMDKVQPRPDVLGRLPASAVYQYNVLPIRLVGGVLTVVSSDPFSTVAELAFSFS